MTVGERTSSGDLLAGPGHVRDTPLPSQSGNSEILGASVTGAAPIRSLSLLRPGDRLTVTTGQGIFRYLVLDQRYGVATCWLPSSESILTLASSTGEGWWGSIDPSRVLYVDVGLQGRSVVAPGGRPEHVSPSELPGRGDVNTGPFVIMWLRTAMIVAVVMVWL